jgi:hypothetical protein
MDKRVFALSRAAVKHEIAPITAFPSNFVFKSGLGCDPDLSAMARFHLSLV